MNRSVMVMGKGKDVGTCYSAAYLCRLKTSSTFIVSEVAADWHELMILWCLCSHPLPTVANNWTRGAARQIYHRPNQPH